MVEMMMASQWCQDEESFVCLKEKLLALWFLTVSSKWVPYEICTLCVSLKAHGAGKPSEI